MRAPSLAHVRARTAEVLHLLRDAHRRHAAGYPALVARFANVYGARKYSLREIAKLDLLDPSVSRAWLDATPSKQAMFEIQQRINPREHWHLTEDKDVFRRRCHPLGLPVPRHFGVLRPRDARSRREALALLASDGADDLVVKPTTGCHGQDVIALRRDGDAFVDHVGVRRSASGWLDHLARTSAFEAFVVQERVYGHPELVRLSGSRNVQGVRMVTLVRNDGSVAIGGCQFKILGGDALVDNFANGAHGNLIADVPAAAGVLSRAFFVDARGVSTFVDVHPRTGMRFAGFRLPLWPDACDLVTRAALGFCPLRTIGWDVALTPEAALLLEGNASWDPPQRGNEVNGEMLAAMRADGLA